MVVKFFHSVLEVIAVIPVQVVSFSLVTASGPDQRTGIEWTAAPDWP